MDEKHSLLNKIRSNHILKDILINAFRNMKSVLKFVAYNKVLLNKLDIKIKDYYDYKTKMEVKEYYKFIFFIIFFLEIILIFIPLLIYDIMFYTLGKFNDKILEEGYDKKKKNYVDIMDNYITNIFFGIRMIFLLLFIIYYKSKKIALKRKLEFIIEITHFFIGLSYFIAHIKKYSFTKQIIKIELLKEYDGKIGKILWFDTFDLFLIVLLSLFLIFNLFFFASDFLCFKNNKKTIILSQINGFDICNFELPLEFGKLNKINKIQMIFKKENMKKYIWKLDETQLRLISKINLLRKKNNIPELKSYYEQNLPDYIINKKTELIFYKENYIYKFSKNYYLIKYPTSECQKDISDEKYINILSIDFLDKINIMRKDNYEYIMLYNDQFNENDNNSFRRENNENNNININMNLTDRPDIPSNNIVNTEDRLNEQSIKLSVTGFNESDNDNDGTENIMIRNIRVNENPFEKK